MRHETNIRPMALAILFAAMAAGCQVSVNGGGSTQPNNPPPPVYNNPPPNGAPAAAPLPGYHSGPAAAPLPGSGASYGRYPLPDGSSVPIISGGNSFGNNNASGALRGYVYAIPAGTQRLPDLSSMRPIGVVYTRTFDVGDRNFNEGFPGIDNGRNSWFAIRYEGTFNVAVAGSYSFRLRTDDGSNLYIDDVKQIDNDGQHAPGGSARMVYLSGGSHRIRLDYFQATGNTSLQLYIAPPGGGERIFTTSF